LFGSVDRLVRGIVAAVVAAVCHYGRPGSLELEESPFALGEFEDTTGPSSNRAMRCSSAPERE
jgi:hypothetical protein